MREGYWVVRTYESGIIGEKTKYWVPGARPTGKSKRREKSEIRKQEQNEYSAVKRVARLLHANFKQGDVLLGLDYSDKGLERVIQRARKAEPGYDSMPEEEQLDRIYEAAQHEAELCIRRVARQMRKEGKELKYLMITSDMDGDTGERVRVHHHLVIEQGSEKYFAEKWKKLGSADYSSRISKQADYTPIAEYYLRQVRRIPDAKKYSSSTNLIRPQPKDRVALSGAEVRMPRGGKLLFRQQYRSYGETSYQPQYIRYIIPADKRKGRRDGKGGKE